VGPDAQEETFVSRYLNGLIPSENINIAYVGPSEAVRAALSEQFDIVLVGVDGPRVVRAIRRSGGRAVLILLASTTAPPEGIEQGICLGADDCLFPNENTAQVLGRFRIALARGRARRTLERWPIHLDLDEQEATLDGVPFETTRQQWLLLVRLLLSVGTAVECDDLSRFARIQQHPSHANLHVALNGLRRRLGNAGALIQTVPGRGYKIAATKPNEHY
jgi:DNA-binding response OmpR family regulator